MGVDGAQQAAFPVGGDGRSMVDMHHPGPAPGRQPPRRGSVCAPGALSLARCDVAPRGCGP
jgi:hypothetical protein